MHLIIRRSILVGVMAWCPQTQAISSIGFDQDLWHYMVTLNHTELTHWGRVTHICVGKSTIIASDNGLSPGRHQAIISTNAGILLIGPLGTKFNEILIEIHTFSFTKMHLKMSSAKWRPFCLGLNVLNEVQILLVCFTKSMIIGGPVTGAPEVIILTLINP